MFNAWHIIKVWPTTLSMKSRIHCARLDLEVTIPTRVLLLEVVSLELVNMYLYSYSVWKKKNPGILNNNPRYFPWCFPGSFTSQSSICQIILRLILTFMPQFCLVFTSGNLTTTVSEISPISRLNQLKADGHHLCVFVCVYELKEKQKTSWSIFFYFQPAMQMYALKQSKD